MPSSVSNLSLNALKEEFGDLYRMPTIMLHLLFITFFSISMTELSNMFFLNSKSGLGLKGIDFFRYKLVPPPDLFLALVQW